MKKTLILVVLCLASVAIAQTHTFPALDTNNQFTGTNAFSGAVTATGGVTANTISVTGNLSAKTIEGAYQADQWSTANNGIANAIAYLSNLAGTVVAPPIYGTTEIPQGVGDNKDYLALPWASNQTVFDWRKGQFNVYCADGQHFVDVFKGCMNWVNTFTSYPNPASGGMSYTQTGMDYQSRYFDGGNALNAGQGWWSGKWVGPITANLVSWYQRDWKYTQGTYTGYHLQAFVNGIGDALSSSIYMTCNGGSINDFQESCGHFDYQAGEGQTIYTGSTTVVGTTNSDSSVNLTTTPVTGCCGAVPATQGAGRYLLQTTTPVGTFTATGTVGALQQDGSTPCTNTATYSTASCIPPQITGSGFTASTFIGTVQTPVYATNAPNGTPGACSITITANGGFSLSGISVGDVVYVGDYAFNQSLKVLAYNSGTGVLASYCYKPITYQATIAKGGHAGQFVDVAAYDTAANTSIGAVGGFRNVQAIHHVYPVIASTTTALYVYDRDYGIINAFPTPHWGVNSCVNISSASRTSGTSKLTMSTTLPWDWNSASIQVSGVTDSTFNATATMLSIQSSNAANPIIQYANAGSDTTSSGGQACYVSNSLKLYNGAEVLSVYNPATSAADGYFKVMPSNTSWSGANVEEPHGYNQAIPWRNGTQPMKLYSHYQAPQRSWGDGIGYLGNTGGGYGVGWTISNIGSNNAVLQGHGGFLPAMRGVELNGVVSSGYAIQYFPEADTGLPSEAYESPGFAFYVGCDQRGCSYPRNQVQGLLGWAGSNGLHGLFVDPQNDFLHFSMPNGQGLYIGSQIPVGGLTNGSANNIGNGVVTETGAKGQLVIAPLNAATNSNNYNSNPFQICGGFYSSGAQLGCLQTIVSLGTGTTPTFTVTLSPTAPVAGALGVTTLDASGFGTVKAATLTLTSSGTTVTTAGTAVAAGTCQAQTPVTIAGVTTGSVVPWSIPTALPATWQTGITVVPVVTANTVTLNLCNPTAGSITPAAQAVNVRVIQ